MSSSSAQCVVRVVATMIAREGTPIVAVWRGAVVRLSEKRQVRAAARVDEGGRFAIV